MRVLVREWECLDEDAEATSLTFFDATQSEERVSRLLGTTSQAVVPRLLAIGTTHFLVLTPEKADDGTATVVQPSESHLSVMSPLRIPPWLFAFGKENRYTGSGRLKWETRPEKTLGYWALSKAVVSWLT